MSDHEVFQQARELFEESIAIEQILKRLPKEAKINLLLEDRFEAHLFHDGTSTRFAEGASPGADLQLCLSAAALTRMAQKPPASLVDLGKDLLERGLRKELKVKVMTNPKALMDKGYMETLKGLGPLLQGELAQVALIQAGRAMATLEDLKARFQKSR